jgi:lysozyme family protein
LIDLINGYCDARQAFLAGLPTFATFGKGWTARVERLRAEAVEMANHKLS